MSGTGRNGIAGKIVFHAICRPPLDAGVYDLEIRHHVPALGESYEGAMAFAVAAPRFGLLPGDVYAVYPPESAEGGFGGATPHVVFSRRTLPWETTLDGASRDAGDRRPWMALLVLGADDFAPAPIPAPAPRTLRDLLSPPSGVAGPEVALGPGEAQGDPCLTLDLPVGLFRSLAPPVEDLVYLAHVREVGTGAKETASYLEEGWFSLVTANRLPASADDASAAAPENRAVLVSLVGMRRFLPGGDAAADGSVRLAVLAAWTFRSRGRDCFAAAMERLALGRTALAPGPDGAGRDAGDAVPDDAERRVRLAHGRGYVALEHTLRTEGGRTVSWYRGPLLPFRREKADRYTPRLAPDHALRYDPADGMFDVSYAAAFQLGRLLALQDRHFAAALDRFRRDMRHALNDARGANAAAAILGGGDDAAPVHRQMRAFLLGVGAASAAPGRWDAPGAGDAALKALSVTIPGALTRWLARLMLLYRVPFAYLAPDERLLPEDSLRFFHLDPVWLKCLVEGACSIGRSATQDDWIDRHLRGVAFDLAGRHAEGLRTKTPSPDAAHDCALDAAPTIGAAWVRSGFMMRSAAVAGWQGLEMAARDGDGIELRPLRIDRLSPTIMLCIFGGDVREIEIRQPPEGVHFGAAPWDGQSSASPGAVGLRLLPYAKPFLRRVNGGADDSARPGAAIEIKQPVRLHARAGAAERVIAVAKLAADLQERLDALGLRATGAPLSSAEFGVQMVESAVTALFRRGDIP